MTLRHDPLTVDKPNVSPATLWGRLHCRLQRRYQTLTQVLSLGGGLRLRFTRIADPDRVLDDVAAAEDFRERWTGQRSPADQLQLPYWAELWESATGVGEFLIERGPLRNVSVLDLGCGMGLAGSVAAALGAQVFFADLSADALLFARLNSAPWRRRVRARRLDWRRDHLNQRFDLILGADILYERAQWEYLHPFWIEHLKDGGRVVLGEPGRQTGELFVPWISERGWSLTETAQPSATRPRPLRIFTLSAARV